MTKNKAREQKGVGNTLKSAQIPSVQLHLHVTRSTGDVERYKLGEVPDLRYAVVYRRRVARVPMPKTIRGWEKVA